MNPTTLFFFLDLPHHLQTQIPHVFTSFAFVKQNLPKVNFIGNSHDNRGSKQYQLPFTYNARSQIVVEQLYNY